jgi:RNA polymerase sigma factor (sigma-70 family)
MSGASLTREGLDALLAVLDADRQRAGERYEEIRRRLVKLFECRGVADPDEAADETMDRVARRLAEGEHIRAGEPAAYIHGVARNVLRERWRRQQERRDASAAAPEPYARPEEDAAELESRLQCLERCLAALTPESRRLVRAYYAQGSGWDSAARKELAASLGITSNALWVRAHRLRVRLERCVADCLDRPHARKPRGRPLTGEGAPEA